MQLPSAIFAAILEVPIEASDKVFSSNSPIAQEICYYGKRAARVEAVFDGTFTNISGDVLVTLHFYPKGKKVKSLQTFYWKFRHDGSSVGPWS